MPCLALITLPLHLVAFPHHTTPCLDFFPVYSLTYIRLSLVRLLLPSPASSPTSFPFLPFFLPPHLSSLLSNHLSCLASPTSGLLPSLASSTLLPPLTLLCVADHSSLESLQEGRPYGARRGPTAAVRIPPLTRIQVGHVCGCGCWCGC